jgi:tight adherence protein B
MIIVSAVVAGLLAAAAVARPGSLGRLSPRPTASAVEPVQWRMHNVSAWMRSGQRRSNRHNVVREFISVLIAELQVGSTTTDALRAARDEVVPDLRNDELSVTSADPWMRRVAVILEISAQTGAPAIAALQATHDSLEAARSLERTIASELAAPRYTAVLLAMLPVFSWVVGGFLGASPVAWLFSSGIGLMVLFSGVSLNAAGLIVIRRIAKAAMP